MKQLLFVFRLLYEFKQFLIIFYSLRYHWSKIYKLNKGCNKNVFGSIKLGYERGDACVHKVGWKIVWFLLLWIVTLLSSMTFKLTSLSTLLTLHKYKCIFQYGFPISSLYLSTVNSIFLPGIKCTIVWSG